MSQSEISGLPPFFSREEGTNASEALQDFYLSWTLRCADVKYKEQNRILYEYARKTVFLLIHGVNVNNNDDFVFNKEIGPDDYVINVKTMRQRHKIDLIAEIETIENSEPKKYVLNIENKMYGNISENQLKNYDTKIKDLYANKGFEIRNLVIFCDEEGCWPDPVQRQRCIDNNYKLLTLGDIQVQTKMRDGAKTGNYMFDEFWHEGKPDKQ